MIFSQATSSIHAITRGQTDAAPATQRRLEQTPVQTIRSAGDDAKRAIERTQHPVELVAAAQDVTRCRNDAVGALPAAEPRILLDPVNGEFAGPAENRKHRAVFEEIDGVIAPFARGDFAPVKTENAVKLSPAEGDLACGGGRA